MEMRIFTLIRRSGIYGFAITPENGVTVFFKKFSEPRRMLPVVRARGNNVSGNFINAVSHVPGLSPADILVAAHQLRIPLPEEYANQLFSSAYEFVQRVMEQMGINPAT